MGMAWQGWGGKGRPGLQAGPRSKSTGQGGTWAGNPLGQLRSLRSVTFPHHLPLSRPRPSSHFLFPVPASIPPQRQLPRKNACTPFLLGIPWGFSTPPHHPSLDTRVDSLREKIKAEAQEKADHSWGVMGCLFPGSKTCCPLEAPGNTPQLPPPNLAVGPGIGGVGPEC